MNANSFGKALVLTSFGESHGLGIGGIIDGLPAGLDIDQEFVQSELNRRRPGQSAITSPRNEADTVEFLSGIFEGRSTGAPLAFLVRNNDQRPSDYDALKDVYRPSHADYVYQTKYGIRDHRGGGRSSARETVSRVVGGAIAKLLLKRHGIQVIGYVSAIGTISATVDKSRITHKYVEDSLVRCPVPDWSDKMLNLIEETRLAGDSLGGVVSCVVIGVPAGLGEPVFDKLHADLGKAMLSINAVKGFEYGSGFQAAEMTGSAHNDIFRIEEGKVHTRTNHSGGIQGGISNGEDIYFNVAFKPVATLMKTQDSINTAGHNVIIQPQGRHDVCVVPRAVPIVEAMAALTIADHLLRSKINL
ncbi:MAG: chorismate synthase [Bacteroidales bacterium]|nr:chorismate synthase [Bacteroidales bacterium]